MKTKQIRQTAACIALLLMLGTSQIAMAYTNEINETNIYTIINESSLPINYGFSALLGLPGRANNYYADGVTSFNITPGNGQLPPKTTNGIHGLLLPDTNGPTAVTMTVKGGYYLNNTNSGFKHSHIKANGMYYTLQFAWNGNTANLFYKGLYSYGDMSFHLYFRNKQALMTNPPPSSVIACLSNPPNVNGQITGASYTEHSSITFFNVGSQPKNCISQTPNKNTTNVENAS